jgi:hypothetical protein
MWVHIESPRNNLIFVCIFEPTGGGLYLVVVGGLGSTNDLER